MRPTYENDESRRDEEGCAGRLTKRTDWNVVKLPRSYVVDFAAYDAQNQLQCFVEFKRRNCNKNKYPTFFISFRKYLTMCQLAAAAGVKAYIIVEWNDRIEAMEAGPLPIPIRNGGRDDRDDWQDQEPMVHLRVEYFRPLEEVFPD